MENPQVSQQERPKPSDANEVQRREHEFSIRIKRLHEEYQGALAAVEKASTDINNSYPEASADREQAFAQKYQPLNEKRLLREEALLTAIFQQRDFLFKQELPMPPAAYRINTHFPISKSSSSGEHHCSVRLSGGTLGDLIRLSLHQIELDQLIDSHILIDAQTHMAPVSYVIVDEESNPIFSGLCFIDGGGQMVQGRQAPATP